MLSKPPVPWWNSSCREAKKERIRAERRLRNNYNEYNKIRYNAAKAKCKYIFNQSKKNMD